MSITVDKVNDNGLISAYDVSFDQNFVINTIEQWFQTNHSRMELDGFRPGKAPVDLFKQRYKKNAAQDLMDKLVDLGWSEISKQYHLNFSDVDVSINTKKFSDDDICILNFHITQLPHFDLKILKDKTLEELEYDPNNDEIKKNLSYHLKEKGIWVDKEDVSTIDASDIVYGDLKVFINKKIYHPGCVKNLLIEFNKDKKIPIPKELKNSILGKKKMDQIEITTKELDDDCKDFYKNPNLNYRFVFTVSQIRSKKTFDGISEDFLACKGYKNVEEAISSWKSKQQQELHQAIFLHNKRKLFDTVEEINDLQIPDQFVDEEYKRIFQHAKKEVELAKENGEIISPEDDPELNTEDYKKIALRRVRLFFFMKKIKKMFNVKVKQDELHQQLYWMMMENPQRAQYFMSNEANLEQFKAELEENKIVHILMKNFNKKKVLVTTPQDLLEHIKDSVPGFDDVMLDEHGMFVPIEKTKNDAAQEETKN
jgi:trigger factor